MPRRRQGWWHPGRDFAVAPFFDPKIGENQKSLHRKMSGFSLSVQKHIKIKKIRIIKRSLPNNQWVLGLNEDEDQTK